MTGTVDLNEARPIPVTEPGKKPHKPFAEPADQKKHDNSNHGNYHYFKPSWAGGKHRSKYIELIHCGRPLIVILVGYKRCAETAGLLAAK